MYSGALSWSITVGKMLIHQDWREYIQKHWADPSLLERIYSGGLSWSISIGRNIFWSIQLIHDW
jgi:hypothetical protein